MGLRATSTTADRRASTAGVTAAIAGVGALAGLVVYGTGQMWGFGLAVVFLALVYWQVTRWLMFRTLAIVGAMAVVDLSVELPVIREGSRRDILAQLHLASGHEHVLLHTPEGWRIISTVAVLDNVMASQVDVPLHAIARRTRWVDGEVPVNLLPRTPWVDEVWLVATEESAENAIVVPRAVHREAMLAARAARRAAANVAAGTPAAATLSEPASVTEAQPTSEPADQAATVEAVDPQTAPDRATAARSADLQNAVSGEVPA